MKIFLYKFVIILLGVFLLFEFTIGYRLKYYERNLKNIFAKQNIESIKQKAKDVVMESGTPDSLAIALDSVSKKIGLRWNQDLQALPNFKQ